MNVTAATVRLDNMSIGICIHSRIPGDGAARKDVQPNRFVSKRKFGSEVTLHDRCRCLGSCREVICLAAF